MSRMTLINIVDKEGSEMLADVIDDADVLAFLKIDLNSRLAAGFKKNISAHQRTSISSAISFFIK